MFTHRVESVPTGTKSSGGCTLGVSSRLLLVDERPEVPPRRMVVFDALTNFDLVWEFGSHPTVGCRFAYTNVADLLDGQAPQSRISSKNTQPCGCPDLGG